MQCIPLPIVKVKMMASLASRRGTPFVQMRTSSTSSITAGNGPSVESSLSSSSSTNISKKAQQSAYEYYRRKNDTVWNQFWRQFRGNNNNKKQHQGQRPMSLQDRNVALAWYAVAVSIGALGASYAAVPLYKVFCQTTGFGGTTQRVRIIKKQQNEQDEGIVDRMVRHAMDTLPTIKRSARVHTWTDEDAAARLASLKPVANAELITVRFDTTVSDALPWTFVPVQLDIKVVPGETALSFFRVTNRSNKAITGVATYNVHPPKLGLYFQKIQCFCFEEQRLLPGETVDMPVFFFIDPEMLNDPQISYIKSVTLSYTFFQTDEDDDFENDNDDETENTSLVA